MLCVIWLRLLDALNNLVRVGGCYCTDLVRDALGEMSTATERLFQAARAA